MINENSRYALNRLGSLVDASGHSRVFILPNEPGPVAFNYTLYTWHDDDRVDLLALDIYGVETLWWKIADANPEILNWLSLPTGSVIRIPNG